MKVIKYLLIGVLTLLVLAVGGLYATGNGGVLTLMWTFAFGGPSGDFDPSKAVAAPDYADPVNWAARPDRADLADLAPAGHPQPHAQGAAPVDVFFVHPTGYVGSGSWIYDMQPDTPAEDNTRWMMANQASAYNSCCNVYAPRYRQANIFAYFRGDELREAALDFAYQDVARAFDYFIENFNNGRPFVLASHSQGTHHLARLLVEQVDGSALAPRLVAAYIIGGGLPAATFADATQVDWCQTADDLGCAVHWDTYSETAINSAPDSSANACTNPLTWAYQGGPAEAALHQGGVPGSGQYQFNGERQNYQPMEFPPLGAPQPQQVSAQCLNGILFVTDQSDTEFGGAGAGFGGGNYHGLDYPLFYMDIRKNAELRVATYLTKQADLAEQAAPAAGGGL